MAPQSRRRFLRTTARTAAASALLPALARAETSPSSERFTIGLSQYSLRALLNTAGGDLDPLDFPAFTAENFGIHKIDLWEGGLPKDKLDDSAYLEKMRSNAAKLDTEIFLHMAGALNCDEKKSAESIKTISQSIPRAKQLGATFLRVFIKAPGDDETAALPLCVEALKPLCDTAAEPGIIVAIEPGASQLSSKGAFIAEVYKANPHPALTLMPDFGKLKDNVYDGTAAMLPHSKSISAKMHSFDDQGNQPDFDYDRLMKMIVESDYSGILAIEWEGSALAPIEGVKASKALIEKSLKSALA